MPVGYRSFGDIWCPGCVSKRQFVSYDPDIEDVDFAECGRCGYVHGKRIDDTARRDKGEKDLVRAIPTQVAKKAQAEMSEVVRKSVQARGLGRMPSKDVFKELDRRRDNA